MIVLNLISPTWIDGAEDNPNDYCAHGHIRFSVDGVDYVTEDMGEWTVSAAALFLLRTVFFNHDEDHSVADSNFLIPCCGHWFTPNQPGQFPNVIPGCNLGVDPEIHHKRDKVIIAFEDKESMVSWRDWALAVLGFADQVETFYKSSSPKAPIEDDPDDREGYELFWEEWRNLVNRAQNKINATTRFQEA